MQCYAIYNHTVHLDFKSSNLIAFVCESMFALEDIEDQNIPESQYSFIYNLFYNSSYY